MAWKDVFEGIQSFSEDVLFYPYDALREIELESWGLANIMTWLFMLIGFVAFFYWMKELKKYNDEGDEDRSSTSHSYLG
tara:strand:- start:263210 stop:263446 length:237 start_codon:yes stop_codon:yes gene_type:complete